MLAKFKARIKVNQVAKVVSKKTKARVKAEFVLLEVTNARHEIEQPKLNANQVIREHEVALHISNEGPIKDRVRKLQQCQRMTEEKAKELERISIRRQVD